MIAYQMENYTRYDRRSPMGIMKFWLHILCHTQGWISSRSTLYIIGTYELLNIDENVMNQHEFLSPQNSFVNRLFVTLVLLKN